MSSRGTDIRKIIASVLLVLEVLAIIFVGCLRAQNESVHYGTIVHPPKNIHLTFSKDVPLSNADVEVVAPKGSEVLVTAIGYNYICGYFSMTDKSFDELNKLDDLDRLISLSDKGFIFFHLSWDCFVEQDEIHRMYDEEAQRVRAREKAAVNRIIAYTVFASVLSLLVGVLIIFLLSKKEWYVLLYVIEVMALFITLFICPSLFLY